MFRSIYLKYVQEHLSEICSGVLSEICSGVFIWNMFKSIYLKYVQDYLSEICSGAFIRNMFRSIYLKYVQEYLSEIYSGAFIRNMFRSIYPKYVRLVWNMFRRIYLHLCRKLVWGWRRKQTRTELRGRVLCWSRHDRDGGEEKGQIMDRERFYFDFHSRPRNKQRLKF